MKFVKSTIVQPTKMNTLENSFAHLTTYCPDFRGLENQTKT